MTEKEYLETLASNFNKNELYMLLNAMSVRTLDYQKSVWNSQTEDEAKGYQELAQVCGSLCEKIKFKIDHYEENEPRKNGVA